MKKLLPILFVLIITSCSKEVPSDQLVVRDGVYYEVNSQTGFTGTSTSYYGNGQLKSKSSYKQGYQSGSFETYYENGKLESKGEINKDGSMYGDYENYHENGQLETKGTFKEDGSSLIDGEYVTYHENGTPSQTWKIQDGEMVGNLDYYFDNGQLEQRIVFKNGVRQEGPFEIFNRDGEPVQRGTTKNGEIHGTYEKYINGKLNEIWTYVEGEVDGPYKKFYSNGETQETGYYKKDPKGSSNYFKDGVWKYFHDNGVLNKQESFKDEKKHGVWIETITRRGVILKKITFKNNKVDGLYESYDPSSGNPLFKGHFRENLPDGEWIEYWENGNQRHKGMYTGEHYGPTNIYEYDLDGILIKEWDDFTSGNPHFRFLEEVKSVEDKWMY